MKEINFEGSRIVNGGSGTHADFIKKYRINLQAR